MKIRAREVPPGTVDGFTQGGAIVTAALTGAAVAKPRGVGIGGET